jgi:hypothetical protein
VDTNDARGPDQTKTEFELPPLFCKFKVANPTMTSTTIKKQVDSYLPLLSAKQQTLVLELIKSFLHVDKDVKRISKRQYNKELNDAVSRMDKGNSVSHKDALKELSKW